MTLRFVFVFSAFLVLVHGSFLHGSLNEAHQSDIVGAEAEAPQEGYLPAEDVAVPHSHHHEPEVGHHHHGGHGHHYQAQSHHHEHGPHHHLESHHHLSESHHHHHSSESHHLIHGAPHHHHHHLEAPLHGIHGAHGIHHIHHHRNCHAIHCPAVHSPTYATDGHLCHKLENSCELAILNCLRRNELKPLLRHISQHECHHLHRAHRAH
ncbi:histidine-rich glycoprotein [Drosophila rhopaloa]|uniref:Histidine-rich glycoprotein n=1 Tax=Drosophila rhopaloa TaxID=1041015 RepID=A0ABM5H8I2_DRORH|nr:histidine-rich glycoprotein [Drosophila rhopaloa]